jgi:uncharacterized protein Yka (UPF0111/DUF47 family)
MASKRPKIDDEERRKLVQNLFDLTSKSADKLKEIAEKLESGPDQVFDANGRYLDGKNGEDSLEMLRQLGKLAEQVQDMGRKVEQMTTDLIVYKGFRV